MPNRARIRKLSDERLHIPAEEPYMEGHNSWCANRPGSTLLIPVGDIAQHMIAILCFMVQNGYALYDDVNGEQIAGLERFGELVNLDEPLGGDRDTDSRSRGRRAASPLRTLKRANRTELRFHDQLLEGVLQVEIA